MTWLNVMVFGTKSLVIYHSLANSKVRKIGKRHGYWVGYWLNGQLSFKGIYLNGLKEGSWVSFNKDGTVWKNGTGVFNKGVKVSD